MRDFTTRFGSLLMVFALVTAVIGAAFAGGAAATITADGDFAGDGTDTVPGFAAEEGENNTAVYETTQTFDADAMTADEVEDPANWDTLELTVEYENNTLVTYEAAAEDITFDDTATGETPAEVTFTVEDSDLEKLPGDAGQITTADVTVTEVFEDPDHVDADADGMVEATESFGVDYEFATNYAVVTAFSEDDTVVSSFDEGDDGSFFGWGAEAASTDISDNVAINGMETDIHVYADEGALVDTFDDSAEGYDEGDRVGHLMTSTLDGQAIVVFNEEPGEFIGGDEADANEDTYAVYHGDGHTEINLGDDRYDANDEQVSVNMVSGVDVGSSILQDDLDYSWWQANGLSFDVWSMSDIQDALTFW